MSRPVLHVFAISHYCEKARWALDYLGLDHGVRYLAPGLHQVLARRLGKRRSSLPILQIGERAIQGSSDIVDWADANRPGGAGPLTPDSRPEAAVAIEQRLDRVLGIHVRRYYYSEALVVYPREVRAVFLRDLPVLQRAFTAAAWRRIARIMIRAMDLGPDQRLESRGRVEQELDWLDGLLADGRRFLAGAQVTRADITAASFLAPLVLPPQHPTYRVIRHPPKMAAECEAWRDRPCLRWSCRLYREHRQPGA